MLILVFMLNLRVMSCNLSYVGLESYGLESICLWSHCSGNKI